jgi:tetratricopeptide (TPR) repeat protein
MLRTFTLILISTCALALSCSRGGNDNSAAGENGPTVNFAEITDANQALALGNQYLEDNKTELAIEAFTRATEIDPNFAEAWFQLGIAYGLIEKEQELEAKTDVNAPSESNAKPSKPNSEKAFRKAIEAYKKIVADDPENHAAFYNLGRAYNKLNEDEEAAKALRQAVKLNPDDTDYQTELGAILIKLAQYREAIPPLKKALELDPENSRAADLLDDAEAGRNRIDYSQPKSNSNSNANANTNVNANVSAANSNSNSNSTVKPTPIPKTTPKPEPSGKPTPKPNKPTN